jgi:hypothetical protein
VHQRGVLQVEQVGVAHAQLATDGDGELAHPAGVTRLCVPTELGDPGQSPNGLQRGRADRGVPPERELGQQQRDDENGQRPRAHDGGSERDQCAGRADGRANPHLGPAFVAQDGEERRPVRAGADRRCERRVHRARRRDDADHDEGLHETHLVTHHRVELGRAEGSRGEPDCKQPAGHRVRRGGPAGDDMGEDPDEHGEGDDRHDLQGTVLCRSLVERDQQDVGQRPGGRDRGGVAAARQGDAGQLTKSDEGGERDGDLRLNHATR